MSIHSSLRSAGAGKKHRSVLKRYERLKVLKDKNVWEEGKTVLGLVKVKMQKLKVKKEAKVAATAAGITTAAPGAPAPAPAKGGSASGGKVGSSSGGKDKK